MSLEITVGPPRLAINQGHSVLITDPDGQIPWPSDKGLYFFDTRIISSWHIYANGEPWQLLNAGNITHYAARIFLANRAMATEDGVIPAGTLGFGISRSIDSGLHEDLDLVNHGLRSVRFNLEIAARCDFADLFEVKSEKIVRRGRIVTEWSDEASQLSTIYRNRDFYRGVTISAQKSGSRPVYANGRISFEIDLKPGGVWHTCLHYDLDNGTTRFEAPDYCIASAKQSGVGQRVEDWEQTVLKVRTSNEEFYRLYRQGVEDMITLRLPIKGTDHMQFVPAAGVPWFVAVFGRDSLIVSLQNALVYPDFARGALEVLGSLQATEEDNYRDAEPGKIMHELRVGELAHFKLVPHTPYYGTADATPLYLIVLHTAWRSTGDTGLLERHLKTAERCLEMDRQIWGSRRRRFPGIRNPLPVGYENQSWKDSGDAVVYPDGSLVKGPKALCELQGYVYDAWQRMAQVFDALGNSSRAQELRAKATALFRHFNEAFWDEEIGFYAYALDGEKKPVLSVASNPGHCLWSGIVPADRARRVVERLMKPDMWSGWGIRTLSANHPAYNPHSYQNGSVWPHDNGIIATGFRRYGFATEAVAHRPRHQRSGEATSYCTRCPSSTPEFTATRPTFPSSISAQTSASLGRRICVCFLANDSRFSAGRAQQKALHRSCAAGVAAESSNSPIFESEWKSSTSASGEMARGPGGKCSREIRAPSSLAAAPAGVSCRSKPAVASTARFQICHATPRLLCQ